MFEIRAQQGTDNATVETKSSLVGVRTYRWFQTNRTFSPLVGLELALLNAKQENGLYEGSGVAAGAFAGFGIKLSSHLLLEFDVGPYFINMTEKRTKGSKDELNFVGDTALIYFF